VTTKIVLRSDAAQIVEEIAAPALPEVAELVASAIVEKIPVQSGAVKREYRTSVSEGTTDDGRPQARIGIGSPRWHFLEYGTATNPPYRPVQTGVESLGLPYEAK
jgi:Bacteriophage HK97-gp10, putative tail-component